MSRRAHLAVWIAMATVVASAEETTTQRVETQTQVTTLTAAERRHAEQWRLSAQEWQRYRHLQRGVARALGSPKLSPIEILGIHASTDAERQRYAELWVQIRVDYGRQSLAWMRASDAARDRLYGDAPVVDVTRLPGLSGVPEATLGPDFRIGDRLMLFARRDCQPCESLLSGLITTMFKHSGVGLDIYFVDTETGQDGEVMQWARERRLPVDWVQDKRITLNHDSGLLARLVQPAQVPTVLRRRGDDLHPVAAREVGQ